MRAFGALPDPTMYLKVFIISMAGHANLIALNAFTSTGNPFLGTKLLGSGRAVGFKALEGLIPRYTNSKSCLKKRVSRMLLSRLIALTSGVNKSLSSKPWAQILAPEKVSHNTKKIGA